jgi:hypothetical protein
VTGAKSDPDFNTVAREAAMLNRIVVSGAIAVMLAWGASAQAQQQSPQDSPRPDQLEGRAPTTRPDFPDQPEAEILQQRGQEQATGIPADQLALAGADTIVGAAIHDRQGQQIGDVRSVVLDVPQGAIAYAVVGIGGFLGVGERNVAVPWDRLEPSAQPNAFILDVDRQTLERAPPLDRTEVSMDDQDQVIEQIARFWQEESGARQ